MKFSFLESRTHFSHLFALKQSISNTGTTEQAELPPQKHEVVPNVSFMLAAVIFGLESLKKIDFVGIFLNTNFEHG